MAAWADKSERFVELPGKQRNLGFKLLEYGSFSGIVEIRWSSDDPDHYIAPIDLFEEQNNGLLDFYSYGKKDKTTTEQAFFHCNLCECELKSVVTLRDHCKGIQHIRKLNRRVELNKETVSTLEEKKEMLIREIDKEMEQIQQSQRANNVKINRRSVNRRRRSLSRCSSRSQSSSRRSSSRPSSRSSRGSTIFSKKMH